MFRISTRAIVIGSIIDVGGSLLAGLFYTLVLGVVLLAQDVPQAGVESRILADPSYYVACLILGLAFVGAAGFVAARIARMAELTHAAIVGVVGGVIGLILVLVSDTTKWPSWYIPVSFVLTLPFALLGGYLAKRRGTRSSPSRAA